MPDWLRRSPRETPTLDLGERSLPVVVRRLAQARRMTLRLAPDGSEVRISIPRWGRTAEALAFAASRADWLAQQLDRLPVAVPLAPGTVLPFRGEALPLLHDRSWPRRPTLDDGAILLGGPEDSIERRLRRWLEDEARSLTQSDLAHYCARAGQEVPPLALSNASRRWGSCAADGTIRINWRLVMAPDFVRRSVVAHEVAHLVHFDHGPLFHGLLGAIYEADIDDANRWLKREGRGLYAYFR